MPLSSEEILFVGRGATTISWYRCGSPAFALGCDWVGISGDDPNNLKIHTGLKRGGISIPTFDDYKVVVLQQVKGRAWANEIIRLKKKRVKVLYEIDDYIHGVSKLKHHEFKGHYTKRVIEEHELCMRLSDAVIVSTDFLAKRYQKFNRNIFVCKNAVEASRYDLEIPKRNSINIGWAGSLGHTEAVNSWIPGIQMIMEEHDETRFISIGAPIAENPSLQLTGRSIGLPPCMIENFPGAMTNFDIAIAPSLHNNFYAGKSDLRFLETGALGIPLVGDPFVYDQIIHKETGMIADNAHDAYTAIKTLIEDEELYEEVSWNVKDYVHSERSMDGKGCQQWERAFVNAAGQSV